MNAYIYIYIKLVLSKNDFSADRSNLSKIIPAGVSSNAESPKELPKN